jgi:tryptophan halogenase
MKIVVAGGGTAGWLAALFIAKNHPNHEVTVVASSKIGVIGAGEAVTGELMDVVIGHYGDFGIDPEDFLKKTSAMPKYGILHKNWTPNQNTEYFGPIDGTLTGLRLPDDILIYLMNHRPDKMHLGSFYGNLYEYNISPISKVTNEYEISTFAFHFDAKKAADYLEKVALMAPNCKLIDNLIKHTKMTDDGLLKSIVLDNDQEVEADFFIDATGFSRLLIKNFNPKWISYKKHLPVNTALPFFVDYEENEIPKCYSVAQAQSAGWYWEASVQHRKGCGYVFSDDFISVDQAHEEIEKTLGRKVDPIKILKFDSGRLENSWIKNCYAIGLASGFSEPLEATSIHSTIKALSHLTHEFLQPTLTETINPSSVKLCNQRINKMYDDFKDFLSSHYLGGRTDSDFWKYITFESATDFAKDLKEMCKSRIPTKFDFPSYPGAAGWLIWCYILAGTNQLTPQATTKYLDQRLIKDSEYFLNQLSVFTEKTRLTHYNFSEHLNLAKNYDIKFNPRRGVEWHLGNL